MKKYCLKKSHGRKYTRRRNIRKYKKNQKGGKTTKRRSLEKRKGKRKTRRMRGGYNYKFRVDTGKLKKYIESEYKIELSKLELVAYGVIGITNRSKGFFLRADHRKEEISVFACYVKKDTPEFYAIARCVHSCPENQDPAYLGRIPTEAPNIDMEEKILFLTPNNLKKIDVKNTTDEKTKNTLKLLKRRLLDQNYEITQDKVNELIDSILLYEFENSVSSRDKYRIVIFPNSVVTTNTKLIDLFLNIEQNTSFIPEIEQYPVVIQEQLSQQPQQNDTDGNETGIGELLMGLLYLFLN